NDFRLTDNEQEQKLYLERVEDEPLALVVLIQTGGAGSSELGNYGKLDSIVESVLGKSPSKLALVTFDSRVRQIWAFPPQVDGLDYGLTHQEAGDSGAAIRDAVRYAVSLLQNQPVGFRRIVLLLSQGEDSSSESSSADVLRDVARSGATIYSLTFQVATTKTRDQKTNPPERKFGERELATIPNATLAELAAQSGGENLSFRDENDLKERMSALRDSIRSGYVLSFRPSSPTLGLHTIRVQINPRRRRYKVMARNSYWLD